MKRSTGTRHAGTIPAGRSRPPASKLRFQRPGCPFELREIGFQPFVGCVAQVLDAKLVQSRPQRAHPGDDIERVFERQ